MKEYADKMYIAFQIYWKLSCWKISTKNIDPNPKIKNKIPT